MVIAVIEDEKDILDLVSYHLKKSNFNVKEFQKGQDFLNYIKKEKPDLIILDLILPDIDGLEICKFIKRDNNFSNIPVIILTAKGEEVDKIVGLEIGADDYITKPFSVKELIARVKTVLRRYENKTNILNIGGIIRVDLNKYEVYVKGEKVNLTTTEFKILEILLSKKGWVFSREKILEELWQGEKAVTDRTIDVHIKNLREKLKDGGKFIVNVRGIGYKIQE
ncbi:MAG: response regulator transcription factor [Candidatus Omnitrophica bacterium]|nr:response regulator transcription factor [Candidatus Omnitrophota bacterium]MCM8810593.1 response regulator transcription factor [Candidatus Omnitrophota bacterium]MCM8832734.1 response regulator transcription factor [Candidatus Omnitrophota bacterium]